MNVLNNYIKMIIINNVQYVEEKIGLTFSNLIKIQIMNRTVLMIQVMVVTTILHHIILMILMTVLIHPHSHQILH